MEQDNELNQNQASAEEPVSKQSSEAIQNNTIDKNLEIFKQAFLADIDAKIEQKLSQIIPRAAVVDDVVKVPQDEIAVLKSKIEQMERMQQSLMHHDLGNGQINARENLKRSKTLDQRIEDYAKAHSKRR